MASFLHVSERSHSGFQCLVRLARAYPEQCFISLQDMATELELSQSYLEEIALLLKQAGLIQGRKGPGGGYRLARPPAEILAAEMLAALEGPLELVACQRPDHECPVQDRCQSRGFWGLLKRTMQQTLDQTTLAQILSL